MQWLFGRKELPKTLRECLHAEQLNCVEDKLDYIIKGFTDLTQAYTDLTAAVSLAVTDIAALATLINSKVAGTADTDLAVLTAQLKAATDAVVAVLAPATTVVAAPVVAAPVVAPTVVPATTTVPPAAPSATA
jgi:hypothetical protein